MSKKIIYSLVGLALVFFIGSLIIFLRSSGESKKKEPGILSPGDTREDIQIPELLEVKVFFLTEESRFMTPVQYELQPTPIYQDFYRKYIDLLLKGKENYITPVPEGVTLRSVYYVEKKQLLVVDFNEELFAKFPPGSTAELEFIYFVVNNVCYNFKEIKMVKFLFSGNEYTELTGHINMENPFYPQYGYFRGE